jgi:hypothetical protein
MLTIVKNQAPTFLQLPSKSTHPNHYHAMALFVYPSAFQCCIPDPASPKAPLNEDDEALSCKINRALASGPSQITKDATIADWTHDRKMTLIREGTNGWTCFPGNENQVGNVPMCCDAQGLQWVKDAYAGKPEPTNTAPGLIYMLCGANQHSSVTHRDLTSPAIPIGPHYMIIWPFDSKRDGLPNTVRDEGAWVMFDGTPYAHLHVCGNPWAGNEYHPETTKANWDMRYVAKK